MSYSPVLFEAIEARRLMSANILLDAIGLRPTDAVQIGSESYFFADNGITGKELWKSDGSAAGTSLVKDLVPGATGSDLVTMAASGNGKLILVTRENYAKDASVGQWMGDYKVWSSDGTAQGTLLLHTFHDMSSVQPLKAFGNDGLVGFLISDTKPAGNSTTQDSWLWVTDGSLAGTRQVKAFISDVRADGSYTGGWASRLMSTGDRLVMLEEDDKVWSSDGTAAGTINITSAFSSTISSYSMTEADGGVVALSQMGGTVFFTDGTIAGTRANNTNTRGGSDTSLMHNGKFYYVNVNNNDHTNMIEKTVYVVDPKSSDAPVALFHTGGDGSDNRFELSSIGDKLVFSNRDGDTGTVQTYATDGTPGGTHLIDQSDNAAFTMTSVQIDGVEYSLRLSRQWDPSGPDEVGTAIAARQADGNSVMQTSANNGDFTIELYRTDGAAAGTGVVSMLPTADSHGKQLVYTLSDAAGKLAIRTEIYAITPNFQLGQVGEGDAISDDTVIYDPAELSLGRATATVRLIDGTLRVGGTTDADDVLIFRRRSNPNKLVVEINSPSGTVAREFDFSKVTKIRADLQAGNDRLEIRESTGGAIKLRTQIFAGDGADKIYTASGRDAVFGGEGGDLIRTRGNADIIDAGGGRDRVNSGAGEDVVNGGTGRDEIVAGAGVDVLFGQTAIERAFGIQVDAADALTDVLLQ